jgi:hypothetical protein
VTLLLHSFNRLSGPVGWLARLFWQAPEPSRGNVWAVLILLQGCHGNRIITLIHEQDIEEGEEDEDDDGEGTTVVLRGCYSVTKPTDPTNPTNATNSTYPTYPTNPRLWITLVVL